MSFSQFSLNESLNLALNTLGFTEPTPIQQQAMPKLLADANVIAGAQTGTGKTAAFLLPILQKLIQNPQQSALVITPTRELCQQVFAQAEKLAAHTPLKLVSIYGGSDMSAQVARLKAGVSLIVATPGRLMDHMKRGHLPLETISMLCLDEADKMLDMGFKDELDFIVKKLPKQRQSMLFSATFDNALFRFAKRIITKPILIEADKRSSAADNVEQKIYSIDSDKKTAAIIHLLTKHDWPQVLIFCRKKTEVDTLCQQITQAGITAQAMHADRSQSARNSALENFSAGTTRVLVATDVAARGIDVKTLAAVINYQLPFNPEDYVHRIGRTGRAGQKGVAITLYSEEDALLLEELEAMLDQRLAQQWLPGFEPDLTKGSTAPKRMNKAELKRRAKRRQKRR